MRTGSFDQPTSLLRHPWRPPACPPTTQSQQRLDGYARVRLRGQIPSSALCDSRDVYRPTTAISR